MTLRVTMGRHEKTRTSSTSSNIQTYIYRCQIVDISQRAFIVLKHSKNRKISFNVGDAYLADKIKLMINKLGEVILISTSLTVLRVETDETHTVESMELSQKHHTIR